MIPKLVLQMKCLHISIIRLSISYSCDHNICNVITLVQSAELANMQLIAIDFSKMSNAQKSQHHEHLVASIPYCKRKCMGLLAHYGIS